MAPGSRHQGSHRPFPSGKTSAPGSRDLGWTPLRHTSCVAELKVCLLPKEETYPLQCLVRACERVQCSNNQPQTFSALKSKMFPSCPHHRPNARGGGDSAPCGQSRIKAEGGREVGERHRAHHMLALQAPAQGRPTSLLLTLPLPNPVAPPPATSTRRDECSSTMGPRRECQNPNDQSQGHLPGLPRPQPCWVLPIDSLSLISIAHGYNKPERKALLYACFSDEETKSQRSWIVC